MKRLKSRKCKRKKHVLLFKKTIEDTGKIKHKMLVVYT